MSHSFIQNCCWITLQVSHHEGQNTRQKMGGKTKFLRRLKQFDGLTWLTRPPALFYDRSTPLAVTWSNCSRMGIDRQSRRSRIVVLYLSTALCRHNLVCIYKRCPWCDPDVDECRLPRVRRNCSLPHQQCRNSVGSYECVDMCPVGFRYDADIHYCHGIPAHRGPEGGSSATGLEFGGKPGPRRIYARGGSPAASTNGGSSIP